MKSVILFGKRNLNFFLRKPFKKKDLIFYAPYCWLWISLTLFMFPVWHKLLSSFEKDPNFQCTLESWPFLPSSFFLFWLRLLRWLELRKTNERKTNCKQSNSLAYCIYNIAYSGIKRFWNKVHHSISTVLGSESEWPKDQVLLLTMVSYLEKWIENKV